MYIPILELLFVHIPKTGGQSVEHFFMTLLNIDWSERYKFLMKANNNPKLGPARYAHLFVTEYEKYTYLTQKDINKSIKFSIVRNPWDRLFSEFKSKKDIIPKLKGKTFEEYIMTIVPNVNSDDYATQNDHLRHIEPQYKFIYDNYGDRIVDNIMYFETLQQDFTNFCNKYFTLENTKLPHKNKSNSNISNYKEIYTTEMKEYVAELYKKDIELFGYKF